VEFKRKDVDNIVKVVRGVAGDVGVKKFFSKEGREGDLTPPTPPVAAGRRPKIDFRADLIVRDSKLYLPSSDVANGDNNNNDDDNNKNNNNKNSNNDNNNVHDYSTHQHNYHSKLITPGGGGGGGNDGSRSTTFLLLSLEYFCSSIYQNKDEHLFLAAAISNLEVATKDESHISASAIELDSPPSRILALQSINLNVVDRSKTFTKGTCERDCEKENEERSEECCC